MSKETFWAIQRRERATRARKGGVEVAPPAPEPEEDVSYRELQARAKELEIPANQSREDLSAAIAEAQDEDGAEG